MHKTFSSDISNSIDIFFLSLRKNMVVEKLSENCFLSHRILRHLPFLAILPHRSRHAKMLCRTVNVPGLAGPDNRCCSNSVSLNVSGPVYSSHKDKLWLSERSCGAGWSSAASSSSTRVSHVVAINLRVSCSGGHVDETLTREPKTERGETNHL